MPQDPDAQPRTDAELAAAAARILAEVTAEPVPDIILELAEKLNRALQDRAVATRD